MTNRITFNTTRLTLRPRMLSDLQACMDMDRDPEVTKFIQGPWDDPVRHDAFIRKRIETNYGQDLGYWSVFERARTDNFIGWVFLVPNDGVGPDLEIGWRLVREAWGKGYATEAVSVILQHGLQKIGSNRIVAEIDPKNEGSIKVAAKSGMKEVAGRTQDARVDLLFSITT